MNNETDIDLTDAHLRCGIIALVGRANVGKSTLINALLEEKVSIVSGIEQTTRNLIRGIYTSKEGQLVFLDTPGVHKASTDLGKIMNRQARASIEGADIILLVVDGSTSPRQEDDGWFRRLSSNPTPVIVLLNKNDRDTDCSEEYRQLHQQICEEKSATCDWQWMTASAQKGDGVSVLREHLFGLMPLSPLLFPADVLTDFPRKLAIGDIIREKLFKVLHQEIPHAIGIVVDSIDESGPIWTISAQIYVHRHSQKVIVIGKKGRLLRTIIRQATAEISAVYETPVKLELWIKVDPKWSKNFWLLKKMGYQS